MSFLLDTDTCSAYLKGNRQVWTRCQQHSGRLFVSAVTAAELFTWAMRKKAPARRLPAVLDLFDDVPILDVTVDIARKFGELRAVLLDAGRPVPEMDLLIAASAMTHGLTLVTHNVRDFAIVTGLDIQDWLTS